MTKGWRAYPKKERRAVRRVNHVAKDLADRKYHQRVKERKPKPEPEIEEYIDEEEDNEDGS
jgi:hypothetical protein